MHAELCGSLCHPAMGSEKDFPVLSGKETKSHSKKGANSENTLSNRAPQVCTGTPEGDGLA